MNTLQTRKDVKRRLFEAGFTWPEEVNAGDGTREFDEDKQHIVFECEIAEGVVLDG